MAVRVALMEVVPMVATTKVLVSLLRAMTIVAVAVAQNAKTLSSKRAQFLGLADCTTTGALDSGLLVFCEAILEKENQRDEARKLKLCVAYNNGETG